MLLEEWRVAIETFHSGFHSHPVAASLLPGFHRISSVPFLGAILFSMGCLFPSRKCSCLDIGRNSEPQMIVFLQNAQV